MKYPKSTSVSMEVILLGTDSILTKLSRERKLKWLHILIDGGRKHNCKKKGNTLKGIKKKIWLGRTGIIDREKTKTKRRVKQFQTIEEEIYICIK